MPRATEEDESSVGSMPTNKSTVSDFSRPIDHTSSLYSGYTWIESRTDHQIDHNELRSRDEEFLEDVEEEEGDGISQKSVGSFGDGASSMGESLIDSDIRKLAHSGMFLSPLSAQRKYVARLNTYARSEFQVLRSWRF